MTEIPTLERTTTATPTEVVISALSAHEDCSAVDLDPPLYEIIDSDALDKLFRGFGESSAQPASVSFSLREYDVELHSDGQVAIDGTEYHPDELSR